MVSYIECGVEGFGVFRHEVFGEPEAADFCGVALFYGDVFAGFGVRVDGGAWGGNVEGDALVSGYYGETGGADFVGGVAVGGYAVGAYYYGVYHAVFH